MECQVKQIALFSDYCGVAHREQQYAVYAILKLRHLMAVAVDALAQLHVIPVCGHAVEPFNVELHGCNSGIVVQVNMERVAVVFIVRLAAHGYPVRLIHTSGHNYRLHRILRIIAVDIHLCGEISCRCRIVPQCDLLGLIAVESQG